MIQKGLAALAALLLLAQSHIAAPGQQIPAGPAPSHAASVLHLPGAQTALVAARASVRVPQTPATDSGAHRNPAPGAAGTASSPATSGTPGVTATPAAPGTDCLGPNCDMQPQHITIATPAPAPAPWTWQQRVIWGAELVLVVIGYSAILIAMSMLRKIERQTRSGEAAAEAAQSLAQAALAQTQALVRAERPWLSVSVLPSPTIEDGFLLMATNRGRGPARIVSTVHDTAIAPDESKLPPTAQYRNQPMKPAEPRILLPGETGEILSFSRDEVKNICETEEQFARVEKWEDKIYLYGKVVYRDLAGHDDEPPHECCWFCWYIHGRQKSGMVMANLPSYNRHS